MLSEDMPARWLLEIQNRLASVAAEISTTPRDLASTLLGAVVGPLDALFLQIGDGAIVVDADGSYEPVFWPQAGEYAGTTHFVTDSSAEANLMTQRLSRGVSKIAMFTDGLERLALRFASREAHAPFFEPLFAALNNSDDPESLADPLSVFLNSAAVNERTDDDKTLLLALRAKNDHVDHAV